MSGIIFEDGKNFKISDEKLVKITEFASSGEIEVQDSSRDTTKYLKLIKKLNHNEYVDRRTGEIKKYNIGGEKSIECIKKSMRKLNKILRNNFDGGANELFITLTSDETPNIEITKKYLKIFWKKLKRRNKGLEYVAVLEKTKNSQNWHIHMLVKDIEKKKIYIKNEEIEKLWNKGHTKTSRINGIEGKEKIIPYMVKTRTKENIPKGFSCYCKSEGIKEPISKKMIYGEYKEKIGESYYLKREKTILLRSENTDKILNKVKKEMWSRNIG